MWQWESIRVMARVYQSRARTPIRRSACLGGLFLRLVRAGLAVAAPEELATEGTLVTFSHVGSPDQAGTWMSSGQKVLSGSFASSSSAFFFASP